MKQTKTNFPRQYGYMSSASRAIRNYEKKHGKKKGTQFVINQLDENCFEVAVCVIPKQK
jgi:hypothetical protein